MQAHTAGIKKPVATEILSPPPRSGTFSVFAHKITSLAFVWLCAIVVWGHTANVANVANECSIRCGFQIGFAVLIWIYVTILMILNFMLLRPSAGATCFSHAVEAYCTAVTIILWIPAVASSSTIGRDSTPLSTAFAWLGFFASIYATFKAYHMFKEDDLPTNLPEGYNEEDDVYG